MAAAEGAGRRGYVDAYILRFSLRWSVSCMVRTNIAETRNEPGRPRKRKGGAANAGDLLFRDTLRRR